MSKSVASEYHEGHESREISEEKGAEDEGNEEGNLILEILPAESLPISTNVSTFPATTDQFMFTPEFRRHFVEFFPGDTLMKLRLATKGWKVVADALISDGVESGAMIVHGGKDISWLCVREARRRLIMRVIFLLNITKVGDYACKFAANLVVVDIKEGIESISEQAFCDCSSLTTVSFPAMLKLIVYSSFTTCASLEKADLLHTNL